MPGARSAGQAVWSSSRLTAASFSVALAEGRSYAEAAAFANAAAALATTKFGAMPSMPYRPDVLAMLHRNETPPLGA